MPKRVFKYDKSQGGVVEVTPEEDRAFCEEISADAASRSEAIETGLPRNNPLWRNVSGKWPVHSDSMACDSAESAKQEQQLLRQHGVYTEYDSANRPMLRDRAHKKAHMEALGKISGVPWFDGDAGYGDASPNFAPSTRSKPRLRSLDEIYAERRAKREEMERMIRAIG